MVNGHSNLTEGCGFYMALPKMEKGNSFNIKYFQNHIKQIKLKLSKPNEDRNTSQEGYPSKRKLIVRGIAGKEIKIGASDH